MSLKTPERLIIKSDKRRAKQVIINLVSNALKFTDEGKKIEVNIKCKDNFLNISVEDEGKGIAEDKLEHIFKLFSQEDNSTTREYGGTGLGTTISKQLAELMGGQIGLESEMGKGSTFWFTVKFNKQKKNNKQAIKKENSKLIPRHTAAEEKINNVRLLLVEDYPTNQKVAMKHLSQQGYNITLAENGKIAVDLFKKKQFDLILMDIQMPVMDGYEATHLIRDYETKLSDVRTDGFSVNIEASFVLKQTFSDSFLKLIKFHSDIIVNIH